MKISKADYEALPAALKGMFKAEGDGYVANVKSAEEVEQEVSGLRNKVDELMLEAKTSKNAKREADAAAKAAAEEAARASGDIATIEKSWQDKLTNLQGEFDSYKSTSEKALHGVLVEKEAQALATRLCKDAAPVIMPHLLKRLAVEHGKDGSVKTRVLDADGKPTAHTLDDLKNEFISNPAFKPIIVSSEATGAQGAREQMQQGGGQQQQQQPMQGLGTNSLTARAMQIASQGDSE